MERKNKNDVLVVDWEKPDKKAGEKRLSAYYFGIKKSAKQKEERKEDN